VFGEVDVRGIVPWFLENYTAFLLLVLSYLVALSNYHWMTTKRFDKISLNSIKDPLLLFNPALNPGLGPTTMN
jgi:hypothetical protein